MTITSSQQLGLRQTQKLQRIKLYRKTHRAPAGLRERSQSHLSLHICQPCVCLFQASPPANTVKEATSSEVYSRLQASSTSLVTCQITTFDVCLAARLPLCYLLHGYQKKSSCVHHNSISCRVFSSSTLQVAGLCAVKLHCNDKESMQPGIIAFLVVSIVILVVLSVAGTYVAVQNDRANVRVRRRTQRKKKHKPSGQEDGSRRSKSRPGPSHPHPPSVNSVEVNPAESRRNSEGTAIRNAEGAGP